MAPGHAARPVAPVHVTVVGDLGVDIRVAATGQVVPGQDTPAQIGSAPGGAGANTAAWLARTATPVSLIARVGDDPMGVFAAKGLASAGVDCRLTVDPTRPTCCVIVLVHPDGERTMMSDRGAGSRLTPDDLDLPDVAGRGHLHLSGYVLLDPDSRPAGLAAIARARDRHWTISVDPQSATHLTAVGPDRFLEWVRGADLLLPNADELAVLGGISVVLSSIPTVAVTDGARGASWYDDRQSVSVPPVEVHRVDSTGSGDAFDAGLLSAWLAGAEPTEALAAGVRAGTAAAASYGARPVP